MRTAVTQSGTLGAVPQAAMYVGLVCTCPVQYMSAWCFPTRKVVWLCGKKNLIIRC